MTLKRDLYFFVLLVPVATSGVREEDVCGVIGVNFQTIGYAPLQKPFRVEMEVEQAVLVYKLENQIVLLSAGGEKVISKVLKGGGE